MKKKKEVIDSVVADQPVSKPKVYTRQISAFVIISVSEIMEVFPEYTDEWADNPENEAQRDNLLYMFGADTAKPIEIQDHLTHRNRLGKIVLCRRYACHERTDSVWVDSGFASHEVRNKITGNKLLQDLNPLAYKEE